jgi:predicted RNA-binding Zn-ribbon protein involved in translation (DUF1610 family)
MKILTENNITILNIKKRSLDELKGLVGDVHKAQAKTRARIQENKDDAVACCPKCGSTSLSAHRKGFGVGKAVIGSALTLSPFGLVAGNVGAKKVRVTCMNCGKQFWAGQ